MVKLPCVILSEILLFLSEDGHAPVGRKESSEKVNNNLLKQQMTQFDCEKQRKGVFAK